MNDEAFVKACRGPCDTPYNITPLSSLDCAIENLKDPKQAKASRKEDPDAYLMMVREVEGLCRDLKAALAEHDGLTLPA
jgi:hypothetical protein